MTAFVRLSRDVDGDTAAGEDDKRSPCHIHQQPAINNKFTHFTRNQANPFDGHEVTEAEIRAKWNLTEFEFLRKDPVPFLQKVSMSIFYTGYFTFALVPVMEKYVKKKKKVFMLYFRFAMTNAATLGINALVGRHVHLQY